MARWLVVGILVGATGCGGIAVFDDGGAGGDAGASRGATRSVARASAGITSATGAAPRIVARIEEVRLRGGCKLPYPEDPLEGEIDVRYENVGGGTGTMTLGSAQVLFANAFEGWSFGVALGPESSGPVAAGSPVVVTHTKRATPGDASFLCQLCFTPGTLMLRYDDGAEVTSPLTLSCAL